MCWWRRSFGDVLWVIEKTPSCYFHKLSSLAVSDFFFLIFFLFQIQFFLIFRIKGETKGKEISVGQIKYCKCWAFFFFFKNPTVFQPLDIFHISDTDKRCQTSQSDSLRWSYRRNLHSIVASPAVYFLVTWRLLCVLIQLVASCPFLLITVLLLQPFSGSLVSLWFSSLSSSSAFASLSAAPSPPFHPGRCWGGCGGVAVQC